MSKNIFGLDENAGADLSGKYNHTWVEESFNFENSSGKQIKFSQTKNYLGKSIDPKKIHILTLIIALGIFIVFIRTAHIQVVKGKFYRNLAEGNRIRLKPIVSERGIIYDRKGKELVQNVPNFSLTVIPQDIPKNPNKRDEIVDKVEKITAVPKKQILDLLDKYGSYSFASLVIKENLDYESAIKLYIESSQLPGISIEKGSKRKYLTNSNTEGNSSTISMSHILGYLGKLDEKEIAELRDRGYLLFDNIGKTGLEKIYETDLRGIYGRKKVEVDALGHEQNILAEEPPVPGRNLVLSLDIEAQQKMENLLRAMLKRSNTKKAAAIAIDPRDGSILALVSLPAFDNNEFSGGISHEKYKEYISDKNVPLFNRAIGGTYPSGSTIKLVVSAAALQEKIVTPATTVLSTGGLRVGKWLFRDWKAGGHGVTNVVKALAWSINTFYYYVGGGYDEFVGLGVDRLVKYMNAFGLSQKTGIDLPGESSGFLPSREWKFQAKGEKWFVGDTYNLSIGQGDLLVTPLQVAVWTSAIAQGKIIKPHLAYKSINPTDKKEKKFEYSTGKLPVSNENLSVVRQGMKACVDYGSCQLLKSLPFSSGGKTGTAQWSSNKENHAWFTAFAPFDDPKIVVTVLVEEGKEGSTVAEPVAKDFLLWWAKKYAN